MSAQTWACSWSSTNSAFTIERCRIYDNGGHGVRVEGSTVQIRNCLISGNGATDNGEGIVVTSNSSCLVEHCTIVNNDSYGMRCLNGSSATLKNSVIAFNGG